LGAVIVLASGSLGVGSLGVRSLLLISDPSFLSHLRLTKQRGKNYQQTRPAPPGSAKRRYVLQNSYIESLHVNNVRQFEELNVEFNENFNFLAGPNGCGKTSVLACISHCFNHSSFQYSRFKENSEFWTDLTLSNEKFRIGMGSGGLDVKGYRSSSVRQWVAPTYEEGRRSLALHEVNKQLKEFCPLFIGANRNLKYKQISGMTREQPLEQKISTYTQGGTQLLYGDREGDIKQWFVNRYFMIDKEWAGEERLNWEHMVNSLPTIGPFDSEFSYVRTGKDLEPVFSIYGEECYLEELSSGFQAVLLIIANIFEWIEGSKADGDRQATKATGTVLIDELDLHLHPEWQFTLRDGLKSIFPNIQFIVTTHSPHLLASAKCGEVIVMPKVCGRDSYNLKPSKLTYSGWNTDQILSEVMGVKSLENKTYAKLISGAFNSIEKHSIEELERVIKELTLVAHPSDTILTVLQAKLAAMVVTHND
jgi:energy-coupling factor transporter ATP-binding protein EcfA2